MRKMLRSEQKMDALERKWELGRNVCFCAPDPPAPDPAIGQAAAANAEVAREALAFNRQQYEEGKPRTAAYDALIQGIVEKQLGAMDKNQALADDYQRYLKETFWPVEKGLVADAQNYDTMARREEMAGEAAGDVRTQFGLQRDMAGRNLTRSGVDPSSGRYADMELGMGIAEAGASASAANSARRNVESMGWARRMDAAGLGRNLPSNQATSQQIANTTANSAAGNAGAPLGQYRADAAGMNAGYGTAIQGNTAAGNLLLGQYNSQLNAWGQAQNASALGSAGLGQFAGTMLTQTQKPWFFAQGGLVRRKNYAEGGEVIDGVATRMDDPMVVPGASVGDGGPVVGPGTPRSDSVPASTQGGQPLKLSNEEFVLNADAVELVGVDALEAVNQAGLQRRAVLGAIKAEADGIPPPRPPITASGAVSKIRSLAQGGLPRRTQGAY